MIYLKLITDKNTCISAPPIIFAVWNYLMRFCIYMNKTKTEHETNYIVYPDNSPFRHQFV